MIHHRKLWVKSVEPSIEHNRLAHVLMLFITIDRRMKTQQAKKVKKTKAADKGSLFGGPYFFSITGVSLSSK